MPTHLSEHPNRLAIVPSMLEVDFARLSEEVAALEKAGADRLQWDLMDGRFVPRLTPGRDIMKGIRAYGDLPFEAHMMVATMAINDLLRDDFIPADKSRRVYFDQAWASMPPVFPAASGGNHVWHMPELVAIFGADAVFQFGGTQGHPQGNAARAAANRVPLEAVVQARNEGRDLIAEGPEILNAAARHSPELQRGAEVVEGNQVEFEEVDRYIELIGYDRTRQSQAVSFVVHRP